MGNFSEVLKNVNKRVHIMRHYQKMTRGSVMKDYNLLSDNFNYVTRHSIGQVILVIVCGVIQIYFVKKLFEAPTKIRARP